MRWAHSSALFTRYTNLTPWLGLIAAVIMGILIGRGLGYPSLRVRGYICPDHHWIRGGGAC